MTTRPRPGAPVASPRRETRRRWLPVRDDSGTILLLTLGMAVLCAAMLTGVTAFSSLVLDRRALQGLADGAALAAAQHADLAAVYTGRGGDERLPLDPAAARAATTDYLRAARAADQFPNVGAAVAADASRVTVRVTADVPLPFVGRVTGGRARVRLSADATATSPWRG
jgi:Flp pilus assembly protein TadG